MDVSDLDFELPEELIAQAPVEPRDASRLLLLPRGGGAPRHHRFSDLPELLLPGDLLVLTEPLGLEYTEVLRGGNAFDYGSVALGGAIKPFTPPVLGEGKVGQFGTVAHFELGIYLAFVAVAIILVGLWFHRAAYKPLAEARKRVRAQSRPQASHEMVGAR